MKYGSKKVNKNYSGVGKGGQKKVKAGYSAKALKQYTKNLKVK